jgi:hypothetical protein
MSDAENQFVIEGLARYLQARETLAAFEASLGDRLRGALKEYSSPVFTPAPSPIKSDAGAGAAGCWVWALQQGAVAGHGPGALELGVWWNSGQIAYYANYYDQDNKAIPFVYKRNHPRVEFQKWSKSPRLFLVVDKARYSQMNEDFRLLLDELNGAVASQ